MRIEYAMCDLAHRLLDIREVQRGREVRDLDLAPPSQREQLQEQQPVAEASSPSQGGRPRDAGGTTAGVLMFQCSAASRNLTCAGAVLDWDTKAASRYQCFRLPRWQAGKKVVWLPDAD